MHLILSLADFSANNIGTVNSWSVSKTLGAGATYSGPTSVVKGASFSATVALEEDYEIGSAGITFTMGGITQSSYTTSGLITTFTINAVTGNIVIKVPTKNTSTGSEDAGKEDQPIDLSTLTLAHCYSSKGSEKQNLTYDASSATLLTNQTGWYMVSYFDKAFTGAYEFDMTPKNWGSIQGIFIGIFKASDLTNGIAEAQGTYWPAASYWGLYVAASGTETLSTWTTAGRKTINNTICTQYNEATSLKLKVDNNGNIAFFGDGEQLATSTYTIPVGEQYYLGFHANCSSAKEFLKINSIT